MAGSPRRKACESTVPRHGPRTAPPAVCPTPETRGQEHSLPHVRKARATPAYTYRNATFPIQARPSRSLPSGRAGSARLQARSGAAPDLARNPHPSATGAPCHPAGGRAWAPARGAGPYDGSSTLQRSGTNETGAAIGCAAARQRLDNGRRAAFAEREAVGGDSEGRPFCASSPRLRDLPRSARASA